MFLMPGGSLFVHLLLKAVEKEKDASGTGKQRCIRVPAPGRCHAGARRWGRRGGCAGATCCGIRVKQSKL